MTELPMEFRTWWQNHRHSGYCFKFDERLGREIYSWNQIPESAFAILRYRVEFEDQTKVKVGVSSEEFKSFPATERAKWREEQAKSDSFAEEYGFTFDADKNLKIWEDNFHDAISILAAQLAEKLSVRKEMEADEREFTEEEVQAQINKVQAKSPGKDWHKMMRGQ